MFKSSSGSGDLNGFLDAGSHITGELHFEDTFRIDGKLSGSVVSQGDLIVGERGEVDGEINVSRVFVSGTVRGTLRAGQRLELTATSKVYADIYTPVITVEEGAFIEGRFAMGAEEAKPALRENVTPMTVAKG